MRMTLGVVLYSAFGSLFFSDYLAKVQWGITAALDEQPGYGCKIVILPRGKSLKEVDVQALGGFFDVEVGVCVGAQGGDQRSPAVEVFRDELVDRRCSTP